ncbi:transposase family protein [Rhizobium sp. Pop5]|nr:transposase family protein [Rhizobium sp. Pop5]
MSRTVRSRYCRQVADLPLSGKRVRLLVQTRRFACDAVLCGRQIGAHVVPDFHPTTATGGDKMTASITCRVAGAGNDDSAVEGDRVVLTTVAKTDRADCDFHGRWSR